jgi:hypothetical protein
MAIVAVIGARDTVRDWKAGPDDERFAIRSYWPWGTLTWQASRRLTGPFTAIAACLAGNALAPRFEDLYYGAFLAAVVLVLTIALFNRPRYLVPPALRDQVGLFHAWAGKHD